MQLSQDLCGFIKPEIEYFGSEIFVILVVGVPDEFIDFHVVLSDEVVHIGLNENLIEREALR